MADGLIAKEIDGEMRPHCQPCNATFHQCVYASTLEHFQERVEKGASARDPPKKHAKNVAARKGRNKHIHRPKWRFANRHHDEGTPAPSVEAPFTTSLSTLESWHVTAWDAYAFTRSLTRTYGFEICRSVRIRSFGVGNRGENETIILVSFWLRTAGL